jgi:para-aminobenzoate synthetase / 4-amino-4-deoxychorismate lyase
VVRAADAPSVLLVESHIDPLQERALLFAAPERIVACRQTSQVPRCLAALDEAVRAGAYVAGFLAYEAGYGLHPKLATLNRHELTEHLLWFGIFAEPQQLGGAELSRLLAADSGGASASLSELQFDLDRAGYLRDFQRIQEYLRAGDSYQVCHSLRARAALGGSPTALFARLRARQRTAYSALIRTGDYAILSLSPELFFRKTAGKILLEPMKGTLRAAPSEAENAALAEGMRRDEKTCAENVMIVDLLRNDVGRLALPGSVQVPELFKVERFDAVLQMTSSISAEIEPRLGLAELMPALFPSGSVTGAPKLRTMEIIAELEQSPRGIFCGSIGYMAPSGDACFNVAIRSLCVERGGRAVLGVGSGVVLDSTSDAEYDECLLKARFVADNAG